MYGILHGNIGTDTILVDNCGNMLLNVLCNQTDNTYQHTYLDDVQKYGSKINNEGRISPASSGRGTLLIFRRGYNPRLKPSGAKALRPSMQASHTH